MKKPMMVKKFIHMVEFDDGLHNSRGIYEERANCGLSLCRNQGRLWIYYCTIILLPCKMFILRFIMASSDDVDNFCSL